MKYLVFILIIILGAEIDNALKTVINNDWSFLIGYVVGGLCTIILDCDKSLKIKNRK